MGKKYIVELENDQIIDGHIACPMQIGYRDRPSFIIDTGIDIMPYTDPDLEQIRKEAYKDGYDAGFGKKIDASYHEGLVDAWDAARTLWNTPNRKEIFGHTTFNTVLTTLTAQEAIEKIRQYERSPVDLHAQTTD